MHCSKDNFHGNFNIPELLQPGNEPKGGGRVKLKIEPCKKLQPLQLASRGKILLIKVIARVAGLPLHIARREVHTVKAILGLSDDQLFIEEQAAGYGPGNGLIIEIQSENITEVMTGYGRPHLPAEKLASQLALEAQRYMEANVLVDNYLLNNFLILIIKLKNFLTLATGYVSLSPDDVILPIVAEFLQGA